MSLRLPHYLLIAYLILFIICAINPYDRAVRWAENIPVMITVILLVSSYKKFQFSNTAYILMSLRIFMHTIGGHYTFERVPFDRFNNFF
jgi:putative membrane protein